MKTITLFLLLAAQSPHDLFQQALLKERTAGDLPAAIQLYQRILRDHASNRKVAAEALLHLAQCYEKQGNAEARKSYERLLRDYSDQPDPASTARERLASLDRDHASRPAGITTRHVWGGPNVDICASPIAPNGRYLAYIDLSTRGDSLLLRDLSTGQTRRLVEGNSASRQDADTPVFSPDSKQIAYSWTSGNIPEEQLRVVSLDGSAPRALYRHPELSVVPAGWSRDGKSILVKLGRWDVPGHPFHLALVSVGDGSARTLKTNTGNIGAAVFSPDAGHIAYDVAEAPGSSEHDIFLLNVSTGVETPLVRRPGHDHVLGWSPDGQAILFASDRSGVMGIWGLRMDGFKPLGEPRLLRGDGVSRITGLGFTHDGTFFYNTWVGVRDAFIVDLDPATGRALGPPAPAARRQFGASAAAVWSPDGRSIFYVPRSSSGLRRNGAFITGRNLDSGVEHTLTPKLSSFDVYSLLHDGRSLILYGTDHQNRRGPFRIDPSTGEATPLETGLPGGHPVAVSPDGGTLFYGTDRAGGVGIRVQARDLSTGTERELLRLDNSLRIHSGFPLSPDGRHFLWAARAASASQTLLQLLPVSGGDPRTILTLRDPEQIAHRGLAWSHDSRYILFVKSRDDRQQLWRVPLEGGVPQDLGLPFEDVASLQVHPTGRQLLFVSGRMEDTVWALENYLSALKPTP